MAVEMERYELTSAIFFRTVNSIMATALVFVIVLIIIYFGTGWILRPLNRLISTFRDLAEGTGDLTKKIVVKENIRELKTLADYINQFMNKIRELVVEIQQTCKITTENSETLKDDSSIYNSMAKVMADSVSDSTTNLEKLKKEIETVVIHVESQTNNMQATLSDVNSLNDSIVSINDTMHQVMDISKQSTRHSLEGEDGIQKLADAMSDISQSGSQIREIIGIINEISDRTNLLSLNASIEAARAGEHGKGFAIVAEEISKLAERTILSVQEIQHHVRDTDNSVENGIKRVTNATQSLGMITEMAKNLEDLLINVTDTISSQAKNTGSVRQRIHELSSVANSINLITVEQKKISDTLYSTIKNINEEMQNFKTYSSSINDTLINTSESHEKLKGLVERFEV